jgi:hypothetical protein
LAAEKARLETMNATYEAWSSRTSTTRARYTARETHSQAEPAAERQAEASEGIEMEM